MYHSSYGPTVDGLQKPEVIAPGIWVAAPILPGTPTAEQAALLARLASAPDGELGPVLDAARGVDPDLDAAAHLEPPLLRQLVAAKIRDNNVISGAYKHVDGTSFAAPIVSSLAAQMLEANPALAPAGGEAARSCARRAGCPTSTSTARAGESSTRGAPWRPPRASGRNEGPPKTPGAP